MRFGVEDDWGFYGTETYLHSSKQASKAGIVAEVLNGWLGAVAGERVLARLYTSSHSALVGILGFDSTRRVLCLCSLLRRDTLFRP